MKENFSDVKRDESTTISCDVVSSETSVTTFEVQATIHTLSIVSSRMTFSVDHSPRSEAKETKETQTNLL